MVTLFVIALVASFIGLVAGISIWSWEQEIRESWNDIKDVWRGR